MKSLRVLLIEDDEDDYILIKEYLIEAIDEQCDITWIKKTDEILDDLVNHTYDIILLDNFLGETTGLELANQLQATFSSLPPIIILTGQSSPEMDVAALNAGAEDYIIKQELSPYILKRSIRHALVRSEIKKSLLETETKIRSLLTTITDAILTIDIDGIIESANPAAEIMFNSSLQNLIGISINTIIPDLITNGKVNNDLIHKRTDYEAISIGNQHFPIELAVTALPLPDMLLYTVICHDITERKKNEALIEHQAQYDSLTDLPNRRLLLDRLDRAISTAKRKQYYGAILYLDLDHFKVLNDSLGHAAGDTLLVQIAKRMKTQVRDSDTVSRIGGDEFIILLPELDDDYEKSTTYAKEVASKLQSEINRPYNIQGNLHKFTPSIGIAMFPVKNGSTDEVLKQADTAMYQAKQNGRDTICIYDPNKKSHKLQTGSDSNKQH